MQPQQKNQGNFGDTLDFFEKKRVGTFKTLLKFFQTTEPFDQQGSEKIIKEQKTMTEINDLQQARLEIDKIDREMADLFAKRMRAVTDVAEYKRLHELPVLDRTRELSVIEKNAERIDADIRPYYIDFLKNTMKVSREYQLDRLGDKKGVSNTLTVGLGDQSYDIIIERGIIKRVSELLPLSRKVLVVTDSGVPSEYAATVAAACREPHIVTIPEGEASKSFDMLRKLLSEMLLHGFTRSDAVVAVGGGVVGDLSGFAASCYMRGIDFYNIPTTLLSQVDSSVGGKTAIDLDGVKNCVGAFYQPKKVLIDPNVLASLPARQLANGYAEAIKMALTCDAELFELMESAPLEEILDEVIIGSIKIKKRIVEADATEKSLRRVLNFGHTLGHGIEAATGLCKLYHGECVALGMIPMCSDAVRARLLKVLERSGLPVKASYDIEKAIAAITHDKKLDGDSINYIFVKKVGTFEFRKAPLSELCKAIRRDTEDL